MRTSFRRLGVAAVSLVAVVGLATPASAAQVDYGYVQPGSSCPTYGAATKCNIILKYGTRTWPVSPTPLGGVLCPGSTVDGMPIRTAINTKALEGRYVAVISGSDTAGQINCH